MRLLPSSLLLLVVACQPTPPSQPAGGAGSTTYTRGSSTVTRSDTTRVSGEPSAGQGVTLTLDRSSYAAGGSVTMRIVNQTSDTLGYNACSSRAVERQSGGSWTVHPEPDRVCTMELRLLNPRETQTAITDLPSNLQAGTHRIVLTLGRQTTSGGSVRAVSPNFRVE